VYTMLTKLIFLCAILIAVCNAAPKPRNARQRSLESQFATWMIKYNKSYKTDLEFEMRYGFFIANSKTVELLNAQSQALNSSATFELNLFADNSPSELKSRMGVPKGYVPTKMAGVSVAPVQVQGPTSFDWRAHDRLTPVKDQGQCGSCWAFSCTESIESVYMIAKGIGGAGMPPLAPQEIVDCDHNGVYGCNGGELPSCFDFVKGEGLEKEASYPYHARDGTCEANKGLAYVHISGFQYALAPGDHNENTMANFVAAKSPVSIILDANAWSFYRGGVMTAAQCGSSIDHAVQAVGYDTTAGYWIVRNSWGPKWGENGFIRLQFGHNTCVMTTEVTVPTL